jgi:capsular exopolysaccharide synthesis family protein
LLLADVCGWIPRYAARDVRAHPGSSDSEHQASGAVPASARLTPAGLGAVRRHATLLGIVAVVVAGAIYGISEAAPPSYEATALVAAQSNGAAAENPDSQSVERNLATAEALIDTPTVLGATAEQIAGASVGGLADAVRSSVQPGADVIRISARDEKPADAARIANILSNTLLAVRTGVIKAQIRATSTTLRRELAKVRDLPQLQRRASALRDRLGELAVNEGTAGDDLVLAASARVPTEAASRNSGRDALAGLCLALLLGAGVVLVRERLVPRARSREQLRTALRLPLLAEIPDNPRRGGPFSRSDEIGEHEGYQTLRVAVEAVERGDGPLVLVVTSADFADGKTTVTANLGRALRQAGHRVLVVGGDTRRPTLHTAFGAQNAPGVADLLAELACADSPLPTTRLAHMLRAIGDDDDSPGSIALLAPGRPPEDPGRLFTRRNARALVSELRDLAFDYIVIDTPPTRSAVDAQVLAPEADALVIVARLHHTHFHDLRDVREAFERVAVEPAGLVVVGTRPHRMRRRSLIPDHASASIGRRGVAELAPEPQSEPATRPTEPAVAAKPPARSRRASPTRSRPG